MGTEDSFERYATARLPVMLRTARAICGDAALAEDLVQDVAIKLHRRWDSVAAMDAPDAYVHRMLVNEFFSWRRKWARITPRAEIPEHGNYPDPAGVLVERDALMTTIAGLPDRQRVVIVLRYLTDLPDAEIAEILGCAQSTVRVNAARALHTLRRSTPRPTDPDPDDAGSRSADALHTVGVVSSRTATTAYVKRTS